VLLTTYNATILLEGFAEMRLACQKGVRRQQGTDEKRCQFKNRTNLCLPQKPERIILREIVQQDKIDWGGLNSTFLK
jgi:hypothetical protein